MKIIIAILISLISVELSAQLKNDSTLTIPPTLEARMIAAEQDISKAKEAQAKAEKELNDSMKILFEIAGKKQEDYDIVGYQPGVIKIKRKKK